MERNLKLANYHTHCELDDGRGPLEEYVLKALSLRFEAIGFSCHAPNPHDSTWHLRHDKVEQYLETISRLRFTYGNRIEIYAGMELEYFSESDVLSGSEYADRLDYTIGSFHMLYHPKSGTYISIDNTREDYETLLNDNYSGDITAFVSDYFAIQETMMRHHKFSFLAHCDLIKKLNKDNRYFDPAEQWYMDASRHLIEVAADQHVRIEANTGGMARQAIPEMYPSASLLRIAAALDVPVVISSDAHKSAQLDYYFSQAIDEIIQAGYKQIDLLYHGLWTRQNLL
ncbi:MAG: histidinol-phosphatase [Sphaerochaetaceae bacterium]|jgi:histidinol-phosphatase (PHP family)|nr:histidinol-phosphatase [Sphaerochaetaceae bacterium]MDD4260015.1 histidinol-phosphatase [Sphaerochaetaceae bacterium]MDD4841159.1 histidinol-phosphatase [Sphaerochaetaceae bacterium]NLO61739.1 histidinol-phosphatase [Spirochaetales bacterium]